MVVETNSSPRELLYHLRSTYHPKRQRERAGQRSEQQTEDRAFTSVVADRTQTDPLLMHRAPAGPPLPRVRACRHRAHSCVQRDAPSPSGPAATPRARVRARRTSKPTYLTGSRTSASDSPIGDALSRRRA